MFVNSNAINLVWELPASANNFTESTSFKVVTVDPTGQIDEDTAPHTTYAAANWAFLDPTASVDGYVKFDVTPTVDGLYRYRLLTNVGITGGNEFRLLGEILINVVSHTSSKTIRTKV